ncbi:MAG: chemotaxis protein, partial [Hydrococcus sp. RM1_1_31]|nr:chemotaxis protein [Hydrococcus sp. RM1_1_31]
KISKVVNLIGRFAAQTHMLALKASIEAARAGDEGQGFAVIADEVRMLAAQSAEATAEIGNLVTSIQTETNEVANAMETGTTRVMVGTKLVEETRQSLTKIGEVNTQINQLVKAIAKAASEQSQASEVVSHTMTEVASISTKTSTEATQVSDSFQELLTVAQTLQKSVGQFKVE